MIGEIYAFRQPTKKTDDNACTNAFYLLEEAALLYAGDNNLKDPLISPIYGEFHGFPPTFLVTGTRDLFLSNTVRVHIKMRAAGVVADILVFEGVSHGDYGVEVTSAEAQLTYSEMSAFLIRHLQ